jgi:hypothetical protein
MLQGAPGCKDQEASTEPSTTGDFCVSHAQNLGRTAPLGLINLAAASIKEDKNLSKSMLLIVRVVGGGLSFSLTLVFIICLQQARLKWEVRLPAELGTPRLLNQSLSMTVFI